MAEDACEFPAFNGTSEEIVQVLKQSKTIAVVGMSPKPDRPSHDVAKYLMDHGFEVIPVNPGQSEILGRKCYRSLKDVPGEIDIVDIFRPSDAVPEIVEEAVARGAKTIWMQLGIVNNAAAERAKAAGMTVVMNKCLKVEHVLFARKPKFD